jgi:outer membrane PBP1 activator LpoA protein
MQSETKRARSSTVKFWIPVLLLVGFVLAVGCGGPGSTPVQVQTVSPADQAKQYLQTVADGSDLGSAEESLASALEALKASDAAKGDELLKDFEELKGLSGDKAKAKAEEMIAKLKTSAPAE